MSFKAIPKIVFPQFGAQKLFSNFIPLPNYYLHSLVQNFSRQIKISFDYISSGQRIWKKWA